MRITPTCKIMKKDGLYSWRVDFDAGNYSKLFSPIKSYVWYERREEAEKAGAAAAAAAEAALGRM